MKIITAVPLFCALGSVLLTQMASGQNQPAGVVPEEIARRLEEQQQQINDLRRIVEAQQKLLEKVPTVAPVLAPVVPAPVVPSVPDSAPIRAPLSLQLGGVAITPTGFLDFIQVWRSSTVSSGVPTNFAGIPFSNTVFGERRQTISSAANSRMGAQIDTKAFGAYVLGVVETDFLGFQPGNVTTTANAYGVRLRLAFADVQKGKWEILGGHKDGVGPLRAARTVGKSNR